jgi:hypothetical protein
MPRLFEMVDIQECALAAAALRALAANVMPAMRQAHWRGM